MAASDIDPLLLKNYIALASGEGRARGLKKFSWGDAWVALAKMPETAEELASEGIDAAGVANDLEFVRDYGVPSGFAADRINSFETTKLETLRKVQAHLKERVKQAQGSQSEDYDAASESVLDTLDALIAQEEEAIKGDGRDAVTQNEYLSELLSTIATRLASVTPDDKRIIEQIQHVANTVASEDTPQAEIERLAVSSMQVPYASPASLVKVLMDKTDDLVAHITYRNGATAPAGYSAAGVLAKRNLVTSASMAKSNASLTASDTVDPIHMVLSLLHSEHSSKAFLEACREIDADFRNKDMRKIEANIVAQLNAMNSDPQKMRTAPEVSATLATLVRDVAAENNPAGIEESEMLRTLLEDKEVMGYFTQTGLVPEGFEEKILKKLEGKIEVMEPAEELPVGGNFKISDEQLEKALEKFARDLTSMAREGQIEEVIGRDDETSAMIDILARRGKKNPIMTGEAGVGKTAVVKGLANRIIDGDVPSSIQNARLIELNVASLLEGAKFRGAFEENLNPIIMGIAERNAAGIGPKTLLFIDETADVMNAGQTEGSQGLGSLIKPHLSEGNLCVIGAMTEGDYAKTMEKDGQMKRRFSVVKINEPSQETTLEILNGLKAGFEEHHGAKASEELLKLIVRRGAEEVKSQHDPDRSIEILDGALARAQVEGRDVLTEDDVFQIIAAKAKVPTEFLEGDNDVRMLEFGDKLGERVFGQPAAIESLSQQMVFTSTGLADKKRPLGVFFFAGPTGVGKTELGRATAELLLGSEERMVRIPMADFMESHATSKLVGAPPGYVGHGEEGVLTSAIRKNPRTVVMLDEFEKAHKDVQKIFLDVFEEGEITDANGVKIDCSNVIFIMSSNAGAKEALQAGEVSTDPTMAENASTLKGQDLTNEYMKKEYQEALAEALLPEFRNRLDDIVCFEAFSKDTPAVKMIAERELGKLSKRLEDAHKSGLVVDDKLVDSIISNYFDPQRGGRGIKMGIEDFARKSGFARWIVENKKDLGGKAVSIGDVKDPKFKIVSKGKKAKVAGNTARRKRRGLRMMRLG